MYSLLIQKTKQVLMMLFFYLLKLKSAQWPLWHQFRVALAMHKLVSFVVWPLILKFADWPSLIASRDVLLCTDPTFSCPLRHHKSGYKSQSLLLTSMSRSMCQCFYHLVIKSPLILAWEKTCLVLKNTISEIIL